MHIHSFIIHIWMEESRNKLDQPSWHGYITPVSNGERHYFTDFNKIEKIITAHLKDSE